MPDPLDVSPDAARQAAEGSELDATGLTEMMSIMRSAFQVQTAAKLTGFSESQSFRFALEYFTTLMRMNVEQNQ